MAGKMIVLSGVVSGAAAGGPAIKMSAADQIAASAPSLAYAITPSTLKMGADGLLTGRDRASGKLLTAAGVGASNLKVSTMGGKPAINTGDVMVASSLNLPLGAASSSYTVVQAVYLSDAAINTATSLFNPVVVMGPTIYIAAPARYYGKSSTLGDVSYRGQFVSGGSTATAPWARITAPTVKGWVILISAYDDVTKQSTLGLNGIDTSSINTVYKTVGLVVDETSYWSIGYSLSQHSLLDCGVGDTYIFNDSLLSTDSGKKRLAALVASMKTAYGVV